MADIVFWFVAFITVFSAGMVVTSKSLLYSAYSLLFTFLGVTGLYIFLWADFLAVVQVVVYIGGILVLIIFGIMLTNKITSVNISHTSMQKGVGAVVAIGHGFEASSLKNRRNKLDFHIFGRDKNE